MIIWDICDYEDDIDIEMEMDYFKDCLESEYFKEWETDTYVCIAYNYDWRGRCGHKLVIPRDSVSFSEFLCNITGGIIHEAYMYQTYNHEQSDTSKYVSIYLPHHDASTTVDVYTLDEYLKQFSSNAIKEVVHKEVFLRYPDQEECFNEYFEQTEQGYLEYIKEAIIEEFIDPTDVNKYS